MDKVKIILPPEVNLKVKLSLVSICLHMFFQTFSYSFQKQTKSSSYGWILTRGVCAGVVYRDASHQGRTEKLKKGGGETEGIEY